MNSELKKGYKNSHGGDEERREGKENHEMNSEGTEKENGQK